MDGLFLIGVFTAISVVGEAFVVGLGLLSDRWTPSFSLLIFFLCSAVAIGVAWPIAVRLTQPRTT